MDYAFTNAHEQIRENVSRLCAQFDDGYCEDEITFGDASLYLGSFLLVGAVASFVSFGRRDVP